MKIAITLRIDPDLLDAVRQRAASENRTLTNYIETALKQRVDIPCQIENLEGILFAFRFFR